jgi:hypothetical protein
MVLQVSFDEFAATVKRVGEDSTEAYLSATEGFALATAHSDGQVVAALTHLSVDEAKAKLEKDGLRVFSGRWTDDLVLEAEGDPPLEPFVVGVAYRTDAGPPGLWIDAFEEQPTQVQALKAMYTELSETGEMAEVSFEEFIRLSDANVVIVTPADLRGFISQKKTPPLDA